MADQPVVPPSPAITWSRSDRRRTPPLSPGRAFLALPAAASLVTLASVACLMAGAWGVLAPTLDDPEQVGSRLAVLGILAAYLGALAGTVWLFCRWQRGNHDAIGAAVSAAALAVGWGVTLDLVAPDRPWIAAACAVAGLIGVAALVRLWRRSAPPVAATMLGLPAALLLGWNLLWPVLIGADAARDHARLAPAGVIVGLHPAALWLPGWLLVLATAGLLLWRAVRGPDPWAGRDEPFLLRPAMGWTLALVALACTGLHQFMLGYTAGLDLLWGDFLPLIGLALLIGNELRARAVGGDLVRDWLVAGSPAVLGLITVLTGQALPGTFEGEMLVRGPLWVRFVQNQLVSPAQTLALLSVVGAWLAWRRWAPGLVWASATAAVVAALIWGVAPVDSHDGPGLGFLNWFAAAVAAGVLLLGGALALRRPGLALAAIVGAEIIAIWHPETSRLLYHAHLVPAIVLAAVIALTVLGAAAIWPRLIGRSWLRAVAWIGMVAVAHCCWREQAATYAPILYTLHVAAKLALAAWRCRDWWLLAPLSVPGVAVLPSILPENKAWLAIGAAFLLLGAALGIGWRRVRTKPTGPASPPVGPMPEAAAVPG